MHVRVVRFTDVTAERVQQLVARIEESAGPPAGVRSTGIQLLFDESQGTALAFSCSRPQRTCAKATRSSVPWTPLIRPDTGGPWTCASSSSSAIYLNRTGAWAVRRPTGNGLLPATCASAKWSRSIRP